MNKTLPGWSFDFLTGIVVVAGMTFRPELISDYFSDRNGWCKLLQLKELTNLTTFPPTFFYIQKRRRVYRKIYIVNSRKILVRVVRNVFSWGKINKRYRKNDKVLLRKKRISRFKFTATPFLYLELYGLKFKLEDKT